MISKYKIQFSILIIFDILISFGIMLEGKLPSIILHGIYFILYIIIIKEFIVPAKLRINNFYLYFGLLASQALLPHYFALLNLSILTLYMLPLFLLLRFSHRDSIRIKDVYKNKVVLIFVMVGLLELIHVFMQYSSAFRVSIIIDSLSYISTGLLILVFSKMRIDSKNKEQFIKFIIYPLLITTFLSFIVTDLSLSSLLLPLFRLGDYNNEGSNSFAFLMLVGTLLTFQIIRDKKSYFNYLVLGIFIFSLVLTKTMSVLIPVILLLPTYLMKRNINIVVIPLLLIGVVLFSNFGNLKDLARFREGGDNKLLVRSQIWTTASNAISDNPILGVTRDKFDRKVLHVYSEKRDESIGLTTHNLILKVFLYNGIIFGVLFFIAIFIIILRNFSFTKDPSKKLIAILIIISSISHMAMDAWFFIYFALFAFTYSDFKSEVNRD